MKISGYAAIFNIHDKYNDIIHPGAFEEPLDISKLPMLYEHDPFCEIGHWTKIEKRTKGLWVEGQLDLSYQVTREVATLVSLQLLSGLSIGFHAKQSKQIGHFRHLYSLSLHEISIVCYPANLLATLTKHEPSPCLDPK